MKYFMGLLLFYVTACSSGSSSPHGPIDDPLVAAKLGEAAMVKNFGFERVNRFKPFVAHREGELWIVVGTLPKGHIGGTPVSEVDQQTGSVLKVYQEE